MNPRLHRCSFGGSCLCESIKMLVKTSAKLLRNNWICKCKAEKHIKTQESQSVQVIAPQNVASKVIDTAPIIKEQSATNATADFITSPMVGTFYRSPSPGAAPYVSVGDTIKKGQTIGIVEAMKIMNEIEAEFDCKILEIEVNDAQPVEFGTKLVMVEKIWWGI